MKKEFNILLKKHGSHAAVAKVLQISPRNYRRIRNQSQGMTKWTRFRMAEELVRIKYE